MNVLPLSGIKVIDFSQFLSGPMATLRLADMGAEVLKIERKGVGDICRTLYLSHQKFNGESTLFHAINRNKNSLEIDLKDAEDYKLIMQLIAEADVLVQNFRPGVIGKFQLDYDSLKAKFPELIYGSVSGYGSDASSPFYHMPGQDLLAQSISGMATELNGQVQGLALADMMAGNHLAEGVLAALVKKQIGGKGSHIEVSLLESLMDSMMVQFTGFLNSNGDKPEHGHADFILKIGSDQFLIATDSAGKKCFIDKCRMLLSGEAESRILVAKTGDDITSIKVLLLAELEQQSISYQQIHTWDFLFEQHRGYREFLTQLVTLQNNQQLMGTRLPIRFDGNIIRSDKPAPRIGEHNNLYNNPSNLIITREESEYGH